MSELKKSIVIYSIPIIPVIPILYLINWLNPTGFWEKLVMLSVAIPGYLILIFIWVEILDNYFDK